MFKLSVFKTQIIWFIYVELDKTFLVGKKNFKRNILIHCKHLLILKTKFHCASRTSTYSL